MSEYYGQGPDNQGSYDPQSYGQEPPREAFYKPITINRQKPVLTWVLIALNVVTFFAIYFIGRAYGLTENQAVVLFGSKWNEAIVELGQWWRLFTAMFVHVNLPHLFFNCLALYYYGPVVESLFGRGKCIALYILAGLGGTVLSFICNDAPAAGASGAIFGLLGSMLYFRKRRPDIFKRVFGVRLLVIIAFNLFYGFMSGSVDNWGHIGGIVFGVLAAFCLGLYREKMSGVQKLGLVLSCFLLLGGCVLGRYLYLH